MMEGGWWGGCKADHTFAQDTTAHTLTTRPPSSFFPSTSSSSIFAGRLQACCRRESRASHAAHLFRQSHSSHLAARFPPHTTTVKP